MDPPATPSPDEVGRLARDLGLRINEELPRILTQLLADQAHLGGGGQLHLECSLLSGQLGPGSQPHAVKIASLEFAPDMRTPSGAQSPRGAPETLHDAPHIGSGYSAPGSPTRTFRPRLPAPAHSDDESRPAKRRCATGGLTVGRNGPANEDPASGAVTIARRLGSDGRVFPQRKKRISDNPSLQPSTLDKFIGGVWESIYSGIRMDPAEVIEQWQAIESSGQPRLLVDSDTEVAAHSSSVVQGIFGRMSVLARKISQTARTCRSLEVIVQAHWVQAFDDHVVELCQSTTKEKAKKAAISEACVDFGWSEKELRNKMAIWRGYHDIKEAGGWAALVFAGMGLYRFCKYRVSFTEEAFQTLRQLRHRFEVAADTLHPRWRSLLAIVGAPTERKYIGHPHDWVVCGPGDDAIPLPTTYHQWDPNFSYTHLDASAIDEEAWGMYDPRTVGPTTDDSSIYICQSCEERQAEDPSLNSCTCFQNLYGNPKAKFIPVQVFRTPSGKNNGLIACCSFDRGAAIGEFIGQITTGVSGKDVMLGQTDRAAYQIWQGEQGNHTRFVNHSCQPNSEFERFVWLGTQRVVLVSKGVEAGEEITVDYSDTYWNNLDKACLCGQPKCRFRRRPEQLLTPPEPS